PSISGSTPAISSTSSASLGVIRQISISPTPAPRRSFATLAMNPLSTFSCRCVSDLPPGPGENRLRNPHIPAVHRPTDVLAIRRLTLQNFRNYADLRLDIDASAIVLTGANGAGKTNLLEA